MPERLELDPQLLEVVDLAVVVEDDVAVSLAIGWLRRR